MSLRTQLEKIQADLGNTSEEYDNFDSVLDVLGVPDTANKDLYTCLITDRLDNATYGNSALKTLIDAIKAVTDVIPDSGALTSIAQDATVAKSTQIDPTITTATYTYLDAGGAQDVVEVVNTDKALVKGIFVDCTTLTQNGTLTFSVKIDGTNYRVVKSQSFTVASDDSIYMPIDMAIDDDFKFSYTEGVDETADRDLPYKLVYEVRG